MYSDVQLSIRCLYDLCAVNALLVLHISLSILFAPFVACQCDQGWLSMAKCVRGSVLVEYNTGKTVRCLGEFEFHAWRYWY